MYIVITPQKLGQSYSNSVADYAAYLEKENEGLEHEKQEHFFSQTEDKISSEKVISEIDSNTAKLKKTEPKFYSIVVSPSQRELKKIAQNPSSFLICKAYILTNNTLLLLYYYQCYIYKMNDIDYKYEL